MRAVFPAVKGSENKKAAKDFAIVFEVDGSLCQLPNASSSADVATV